MCCFDPCSQVSSIPVLLGCFSPWQLGSQCSGPLCSAFPGSDCRPIPCLQGQAPLWASWTRLNPWRFLMSSPIALLGTALSSEADRVPTPQRVYTDSTHQQLVSTFEPFQGLCIMFELLDDILGWPKSLFRFSHHGQWKNPNELFGQAHTSSLMDCSLPISLLSFPSPYGSRSSLTEIQRTLLSKDHSFFAYGVPCA